MKTPEMENMLDSLAKAMFGRGRHDSMDAHVCVSCGEDASEFRDELSRKEFAISGLCQRCQDAVFTEE